MSQEDFIGITSIIACKPMKVVSLMFGSNVIDLVEPQVGRLKTESGNRYLLYHLTEQQSLLFCCMSHIGLHIVPLDLCSEPAAVAQR